MSDSERSPNYDIIYSISKTETITWFICFNQCMGLFLFLFFFFLKKKLYFYLFSISFSTFLLLFCLFFLNIYGKVVTGSLMKCCTN